MSESPTVDPVPPKPTQPQTDTQVQGEAEASSIKQRLWGLFKFCTRVIVYVPLSLLIIIALLIGTEIGSRLAVNLADKFVPDLELTYTSGTLNKDLSLSHAAWSMDGIKVELKQLQLVWQPTCLFQKQLCVKTLNASKVDVNIDTVKLSADAPEVAGIDAQAIDSPETTVPNASDSGSTIDNATSEPYELVLPFGIRLDSAALNAINVAVDDMRFSANHIDASATWFAEGLNVKQLNSEGLAVLIPLGQDETPSVTPPNTTTEQANVTATDSDATTLKAPADTNAQVKQPVVLKSAPASAEQTQSTAPKSEPSASDDWAMAQLPAVFMPFPINVERLVLDNTRLQLGERIDLFNHAELQGSYIQYQLNVIELQLEHSYGKVSLAGQLALEQDYPLSVELSADLLQVAELPELSQQHLQLSLGDNLGSLAIKAIAKGDADFTLDGHITLADPELPYNAKLTNARLQWPLKEAEYFANELNIESQGSLTKQSAKLDGKITTPFHKALSIGGELVHHDTKLEIPQFHAKGELGALDISGELDYADAITWNAKVLLDNLKLQEILLPPSETTGSKEAKTATNQTAPKASAPTSATNKANVANPPTSTLPTSLISGQVHTSGKYHEKHWQVVLTDTQLSGTLQDYPFDISADVSLDDNFYISAKGVNAKVLGSTLTLTGEANKNWNLQGELQVPDFGLWLNKAHGQLHASINVTGDEKHPQLELTSQLVDLNYDNIKLLESSLKAYYKPLDAHEFAISLKSKALQLGSKTLDSITFGTKGNIDNQKLTLNTTGDLGLDLGATSQYNLKKSQLQAQINKVNLLTPVGRWELDKDIFIDWDQNKAKGNIAPFCLLNPNSKVCLDNTISLGKSGAAQLSYAGSPGKLLSPMLPKNMIWNGNASLLANLAWSAGRKPTANVNLEFSPGSIQLKRAKNREVTVAYQQFDLNANLDAKRLLTSIQFESEGIASWQSEISVNVTPDRALSGYANIKQINLQPLGEFLPQLNTLEGLLTSRLKFAGSLDTPEVSGNISLSEGAIALTANPTLINKMDMSIDLSGQQASLKGRWMMGDGLGRISGDIQWPLGQFSGVLAIKGDKLAVIQPPLALLDVSPDLTIGFSREQLEVKGVVNVPSGNIKIVQLAEGGVALSEDVVFNDSIAAAEPQANPYAIVADLNINVGNDLKVDGMGLKGKLQGTLKLQQQAFRPPLLFGDIKVDQGNYKFMGQTLKISTGEVQFVGPIAVPNLNIEAIREIKSEDLVAGVRITGTPTRPVVTLFSNPAKEQAEILSYIVKGSGFNSSNNEQNNSLMMGAALGLGSQVGGGAFSNLGSTAAGIIEEFGFSNVQLDTNDEGRVAISGFIGDNLMVKYGVGVFNPGYEMTVRYYLLSQLYLETVSGTLGQSLDIYYNFNID